MTSVITLWFGNKILTNNLFKYGAWVGLHIDVPQPGIDLNEVIGGGYIRQKAGFNSPTSKTIATNVKLIFASMPICTITHISFNTQQVAGNMYSFIQLDDPVDVAASAHFVIPAGDLALTL